MRNLWLLLQRHAFLLAFVALMGLSLSVLVRHDGSARSSWFAATGGLSAAVEGQRLQWSDYLQLAEQMPTSPRRMPGSVPNCCPWK